MATVIDVSYHQNKMDFSKAKSSGIKGVMLRASYENSTDTKFEKFYNDAKAQNFDFVGCYVYSTCFWKDRNKGDYKKAVELLNRDTQHVLSIVKGKEINYIALDLEFNQTATTTFSKAQITELVNLFADKVKKAGYIPLFYSFADFFISYVNWKDIKCDFWVAYTVDTGNKNNFPNTVYGKMMKEMGNKLKLWQYSHTANGSTYGATSENIDLNYDYLPTETTVSQSKPTESKPTSNDKAKDNTSKNTFSVGDKVILNGYLFSSSFGAGRGQVRKGTTHTVTRIADTKRTSPYLLDNGLGWVRKQDLTLVNQTEKTKAKENTKIKPIISKIKVGDTVTVKNSSKTYDGKNFAEWVTDGKTKFKVLEIKGDRVVIGNSKGEVTGAIKDTNLNKV